MWNAIIMFCLDRKSLSIISYLQNSSYSGQGVVMVVLDKKEYIEKPEALLAQLAYRTIDKDPTNRLKLGSSRYLGESKG